MLALSSLSRNSRYVALFWLGIVVRQRASCRGVLQTVDTRAAAMHEAHRAGSGGAAMPSDVRRQASSKRPRATIGGRWFRTPRTCRASGSSCSATDAAWEKLSQAAAGRASASSSC